jgi:nucleoside-diphosphate-sugar epimerase
VLGFPVVGIVRLSNRDVADGVGAFAIDDLHDEQRLVRGFQGSSAVVHLAGRAHVFGKGAEDLAAFRKVNVDGTRAVLRAAIDAGVEIFVYVSSLAAASPSSAYGRSKREAEEMVRSLAETAGLRATILRPAMTYGPGMKGNPLWLFHAIDKGRWLPVGSIRNARSVLFSGNLAAAVLAVLMDRQSNEEPLAVADETPISTPDLVREVASALGKPARMIPVPPPVLRGLGLAGDLLPRMIRFPLRSSTIDRLIDSLAVDVTPLQRLGYTQRYSTCEGLEITARWYRSIRARRRTAH